MPLVKHLFMSILASLDDPKTQVYTATFLATRELPHLIHDSYETLARQSLISDN